MDEEEFELAKKQVEALLLVAKELCAIRQALGSIAESCASLAQVAIYDSSDPRRYGGDD